MCLRDENSRDIFPRNLNASGEFSRKLINTFIYICSFYNNIDRFAISGMKFLNKLYIWELLFKIVRKLNFKV